jgi:hypothetical protein
LDSLSGDPEACPAGHEKVQVKIPHTDLDGDIVPVEIKALGALQASRLVAAEAGHPTIRPHKIQLRYGCRPADEHTE